jgi:hypothetical protein
VGLEALKVSSAPVGQRPTGQRQPAAARRGLPRETVEAIAQERWRCEGLSLRQFAQHLHERGIYSSMARDGSRRPVDASTLGHSREQAREAGLLSRHTMEQAPGPTSVGVTQGNKEMCQGRRPLCYKSFTRSLWNCYGVARAVWYTPAGNPSFSGIHPVECRTVWCPWKRPLEASDRRRYG